MHIINQQENQQGLYTHGHPQRCKELIILLDSLPWHRIYSPMKKREKTPIAALMWQESKADLVNTSKIYGLCKQFSLTLEFCS